jgi:hypothetical protein
LAEQIAHYRARAVDDDEEHPDHAAREALIALLMLRAMA